MVLGVLEVLFEVVEDEVLEDVCDFLGLCCCLPGPHMAVLNNMQEEKHVCNEMGAMQLIFFMDLFNINP